MTSTATTVTTTEDPGGFWDYLKDHIWIPILVGVLVLLLVICLILWLIYKYRHGDRERYDYSALEDEMGFSEKLRLEREMQLEARREAALLNCQFYLRSMTRHYSMVEHLPDIGSRVSKNWFLVHDNKTKRNKMMTMTIRPPSCLINFNRNNRKTLQEMLQLIHHPYLLPVDDIDFVPEQDLLVIVQQYNAKGSLKDLIYKSKPKEVFEAKYSVHGRGLPLPQIQLYGKHILEAVIYLADHGINVRGHVQSGNIILVNDVCRFCSYENAFFGFTARSFHAIRRRLTHGKDEADRLAFGMLLYEMCAGCELDTCNPTEKHLQRCEHMPAVQEILNFIFYSQKGKVPAFHQIKNHDFFKDCRLLELERHRPLPMHFTSSMKSIVKHTQLKKKERMKPESRRRTASNPEKTSTTPPQVVKFTKSLPAYGSTATMHSGSSVENVQIQKSGENTDRSALLQAIQRGTTLKKTHDTSSPRV